MLFLTDLLAGFIAFVMASLNYYARDPGNGTLTDIAEVGALCVVINLLRRFRGQAPFALRAGAIAAGVLLPTVARAVLWKGHDYIMIAYNGLAVGVALVVLYLVWHIPMPKFDPSQGREQPKEN